MLAIHWRRTDCLVARSTQPGVLQSAASVIRHARRAIERHGLAGVYLATDSDDQEEMREVGLALAPVRYGPAVASHRPIDEVFAAALPAVKADAANVEIAICAMAARFLGTKTSSFPRDLGGAAERLRPRRRHLRSRTSCRWSRGRRRRRAP